MTGRPGWCTCADGFEHGPAVRVTADHRGVVVAGDNGGRQVPELQDRLRAGESVEDRISWARSRGMLVEPTWPHPDARGLVGVAVTKLDPEDQSRPQLTQERLQVLEDLALGQDLAPRTRAALRALLAAHADVLGEVREWKRLELEATRAVLESGLATKGGEPWPDAVHRLATEAKMHRAEVERLRAQREDVWTTATIAAKQEAAERAVAWYRLGGCDEDCHPDHGCDRCEDGERQLRRAIEEGVRDA